MDAAAAIDLGNATTDPQVANSFTHNRWEAKHYKFQGTKGERLYFDKIEGTPYTRWSLYDPSGTEINETTFYDFEQVLPGDGEYLLVLNAEGQSDTDYQFQIIAPPELPAETLEFTTANDEKFIRIQDELVEAGQQKTYVFQGNANQRLWFDSLKNDSSIFHVALYDPNGVVVQSISSQYTRYDLSEPIALPQTGEYRLVVDGYQDAIEEYDFRLLDLESRSIEPWNNDTNIEFVGNFGDTKQETHAYRFTGSAGQLVYFDAIDGASSNKYYLYTPEGKQIFSRT
ncbi:hypothetical protein [Spirulina sp. 06S082]|uniref:hypothetical protein n=1 Tax=Spirulina sp. 06S082 TaxID=3110248 RepID=UPI002B1EBD7D|nr:hypothetical protein [Spirulina sp. 06S082]MEA5471930.1 hypothetical protein [Spirulina sp. 06S082]